MPPQPSPSAPRPIEVILSCTCCQRTIAEIYHHAEGDKGFRHDSDNATAQPVPKLWMTECAHLICSDHLDGGGVPFHPEGSVPKVACPHCSKYGDNTVKELYYIRGVNKGQYDKQIPEEYFTTPPVHFDGNSNGMNALSFHYRQLIHFGTNVLVKYHEAEKLIIQLREIAETAEKDVHKSAQRIDTLTKRSAHLEQCERELKPWKEREGKITHYLNTFTKVVAENDKLREQMTALGYAVPKRTWSIDTTAKTQTSASPTETISKIRPRQPEVVEQSWTADQEARRPDQDQPNGIANENSSSSRTIPGPSEPVRNLHTDHNAADHTTNSRKRPAEQEHDVRNRAKSPRVDRPGSAQLMPPPPVPFKRPPTMSKYFGGPPRSSEDEHGVHGLGHAPLSTVVPDIAQHQRERMQMRDNHQPSDANTTRGLDNEQGRNTSENIYWNQRSSPSRVPRQFQESENYGPQGLIVDPRLSRQQSHQRGNVTNARSMNMQAPIQDIYAQGHFDQDMVEPQSLGYANDDNFQFENNYIHSDPGSVLLSDHGIPPQNFSDPSLRIPPPSTARHSIPRGRLNDITSPFFSSQNSTTPSRQRMTLPSRVKTSASSSQYDINHLSFINRPHNPSNYQPIAPSTGYNTSFQSAPRHGGQRHSNTSAPIQRPSGSNMRATTRSTIMTPFRPPTFQQPRQVQRRPQVQGDWRRQQPQQQQGYGVNAFMPATPRRQDQQRQFSYGTPMLMPSRAGTAMTAQDIVGNGGGGRRFDSFAYRGSFGR